MADGEEENDSKIKEKFQKIGDFFATNFGQHRWRGLGLGEREEGEEEEEGEGLTSSSGSISGFNFR